MKNKKIGFSITGILAILLLAFYLFRFTSPEVNSSDQSQSDVSLAEPGSFIAHQAQVKTKERTYSPPQILTDEVLAFQDELKNIEKNYKKSCPQLEKIERRFEDIDAEVSKLIERIQSGENTQELFSRFNQQTAERTKLSLTIAFCKEDELENRL